MSDTGGLWDDRSANKQRPLVTLPFSPVMAPCMPAGAISIPHPGGRRRREKARIRIENQKLTLMLPLARMQRLPRHLPGTWVSRLGAQTGSVSKSASGLNSGDL